MLHSIQEHAPKEKREIWPAGGSNGAQRVAQTVLDLSIRYGLFYDRKASGNISVNLGFRKTQNSPS